MKIFYNRRQYLQYIGGNKANTCQITLYAESHWRHKIQIIQLLMIV